MADQHKGRTRNYGLGISRSDALAAARAAGYACTPPAPGRGRPHAVARSSDGSHYIELIGPEARVFKAVLVADLTADVTAVAAWFLATFAPDWPEAPAWLGARLPDVAAGCAAEARLPRLHARLRRLGHQHAAILTLTWAPD